ncbi:MAG: AAA family ATPase [Parcubacteria group bacterium]
MNENPETQYEPHVEEVRHQYDQVLNRLVEQRMQMLGVTEIPADMTSEQILESLTIESEEKKNRDVDFLIMQGTSGSGKTTIGKQLEQLGIRRFPRHTDRQPRPGEEHGREHFYVSPQEFDELMRAERFIGTPASTYGERRGIDQKMLEEYLRGSKFYIDGSARTPLDLLSQKEQYDFLSVFVLTPSFDELLRRLHARTTQERAQAADQTVNSDDQILKRITGSVGHLEKAEKVHGDRPVTDIFVVNDDAKRATGIVRKLLKI